MIFAGYEALFFQTRAPVVGVMAGVGMCEIGIAADSVFDLQAHGPGMVVVRHKGHDQQQEQGPAQKGYGGLSFHVVRGEEVCKYRIILRFSETERVSSTVRVAPGFRDPGHHGLFGTLVYVGSYGYSWSCTPRGDATVRYLDFNTQTLNPSRAHYRGHGFQLRCLSE
nr:hypothetical protein [uncultured Rikenella sp.]